MGHHFFAILLANILIWAPFSQLMCAFSFSINPWCHKSWITFQELELLKFQMS